MQITRYDNNGQPAVFVSVAGDDEFLNAEVNGSDVHVAWSSQLDVASA